MSRLTLIVVAGALAAGIVFRFVWPDLLEFKHDEAWTVAKTREMVERSEFPPLGMPSSQKLRNPPLSVWAFAPIGLAFGTDAPDLARGVAVGSVLALLGLLAFAWRCVPAGEREPWAWAVAVAAVNPIAVLYHRKIWPPCVTPLLCLAGLVGYFYRDRRWGAALWGFVTAVVGQIHVLGFWFAAGLGLWALLFDRRRTRWLAAVLGGAIGLLPMLHWAEYLLTTVSQPDRERSDKKMFDPKRLYGAKFWPYWVTEPVGLGAEYHLGGRTPEYLRGPEVNGSPTYLVAAAYGVAVLAAVGVLGLAVRRGLRVRPRFVEWLRGGGSPTDFLVKAGFLGFGLVFTLSLVMFNRHYLMVAFPLPFLWLTRAALGAGATDRERAWGRACLTALVCAQAVLTAALLLHLHDHGGGPDDGFGKSYGRQVADRDVWPVPPW